MNTDFSRMISRKPEYVKIHCIDRNNIFHFACSTKFFYNESKQKQVRKVLRIQYIQRFVNLKLQFYENIIFLNFTKTPLANSLI